MSGTVAIQVRYAPTTSRACSGEAHRRRDVAWLFGTHDEGRMLVGDQVPGLARGIPARVARGENITGDRVAKRVYVDGGPLVHVGVCSTQPPV